MPFAVIARSGATWQSHCYNRAFPGATSLVNFTIAVVFVELKYDNLSIASQVWARDCFALLAMTEPELIEKLRKYQTNGKKERDYVLALQGYDRELSCIIQFLVRAGKFALFLNLRVAI